MSTITSILGTDLLSNSYPTINTNFASLNTSKVESSLLSGSYSTASTISGTFATSSTLTGSYSTTSMISGSFITASIVGGTYAPIASPTFTGSVMGTSFTGNAVNYPNNAITAVSNAATVPVTSRLTTVTNNSAATLTVTFTTFGAADGQFIVLRIYDFSGVAQTLTFVNTENSSGVSVPASSNGSTTLPLTIGFQFNSQTTKWRCLASS